MLPHPRATAHAARDVQLWFFLCPGLSLPVAMLLGLALAAAGEGWSPSNDDSCDPGWMLPLALFSLAYSSFIITGQAGAAGPVQGKEGAGLCCLELHPP